MALAITETATVCGARTAAQTSDVPSCAEPTVNSSCSATTSPPEPYNRQCWPPWACCAVAGGSLVSAVACGAWETLSCIAPSPYRLLNGCGACSPFASRPVAVVTGGNRGLGRQTARILAQRGYHVILACRDTLSAERTANHIGLCGAHVESIRCDLADYQSIEAFASELRRRHLRVHLLINNAGVVGESAVRVNHLGHFALTL